MPMIRARVTAEETEAKRIAGILEAAFEEEAYPVSVYETVMDGPWVAEILFFDGDPEAVRAEILDKVGTDAFAAPVVTDVLEDIDWIAKGLESLTPVSAGRFVVHGSHDRDKISPYAIGIEIEAAQAFGTGHHGTTVGCLEELCRVLKRRHYKSILDLGTGSGVLAIGMAKLAHLPVLATDIDPVATAAAKANARLNEVLGLVECVTATGVDHPRIRARAPFDLVVANILARPLMALARSISLLMAKPGTLVLSGLRVADGPRVIASYRGQGFRLTHRIEHEDWLTLTFANTRTEL
ncbi:50S ribosomal protein L11 methyltransferase [Breoghania sp.]|uniref:50S ribosomal protein L11 methyltransferase n=1 Tax=Breoghania sp. TaxID=2065378 RepID=UPI00260F2F81|nr:50S ribosomal protein L11 methyltransferase [Breoghania sp.]MDJ0931165.1 50S ribosomal protein L11 methyltransferase [Breoghania sp.]